MFNIFENPFGLLTIAVGAALVLWIFRCAAPEKTRWWFWFIPALIAGAAISIDRFVDTDNEKIEKAIYSLVKTAEQENCDAMVLLISDNYSDSFHNTKKQLINHCRAKLDKPIIEKAIPKIVSIEQSSLTSTAIFTVRVLFDKQSDISQYYKADIFFKVQAGLEKQPDSRWLISYIEILEIDRFAANWHEISK